MDRTPGGGLTLTADEVEGLKFLLLAEQRRVVDIHATTFSDIDNLVNGWESVMGPLADVIPA